MTRCLRCNDETHSHRKIALRDYTDTEAMYHEGRLCARCWEIIAGELVGFDVGLQVERRNRA